jgi:hypothetical protein
MFLVNWRYNLRVLIILAVWISPLPGDGNHHALAKPKSQLRER